LTFPTLLNPRSASTRRHLSGFEPRFVVASRFAWLFDPRRINNDEAQDLHAGIEWADSNNTRWAFSLSNAGAYYTEFRGQLDELDQLDWSAILARDFRDREVKEGKQAEFLLYERFPFELIERIGIRSGNIKGHTATAFAGVRHPPQIEVRPDWYY